MKNTIIFVLIIIILTIGSILYLYRDVIKNKLNRTSGKVKENVIHAAKKIKEDIKNQ